MDTTYLYMYAMIQVFIMVERFALSKSRGQGRGHSFVKNLGLLTGAKSRNFRKIPHKPFSCLAAANGILSPGEHFRERYT